MSLVCTDSTVSTTAQSTRDRCPVTYIWVVSHPKRPQW